MKLVKPLSLPWSASKPFRDDRRGVVIAVFALMLPIIVGFIGLGVETAFWFSAKRELQSIADAAAIAAAYEAQDGSDDSAIQGAAEHAAGQNGWASSNHGAISPAVPTSGSFSGDTAAREVSVTRSVNLIFTNMFLDSAVSITARAVARASGDSEACVLALDDSASGALSNQGNADITMTGCDIAANSSDDKAIDLGGNSSLTVDCGYTVGGTDIGSNVDLTTNCSTIVEGTSAISDPYSSVPDPTIDSCDETNFSVSSGTITEGTYCRGINFSGNVTMDPGTYIIDRGSFKVNSGATLTSNGGVTIILTSSTGAQYADVSINGGAIVDLAAQTSGDYSGILFYGDRNGTEGLDATFNGGATADMTGALYFPKGDVKFTGGVSSGGSCTQIIGLTVTFNGDADLKIDCDGAGLSAIETNVTIGLVE